MKPFLESECLSYVLSLINHENIDISIDAINFVADLLDQEMNDEFKNDILNIYNYIVAFFFF